VADYVHLPIYQLALLLQRKELSPVELTNATLQRIERYNPKLNGFITVTADEALREAQAAEQEIGQGRYRGPLHGIPITIKDLFATRGVRTTGGSKLFADWVPDHDATAVARLRAAGAVIVGKTNLHELAYGVTNDNPHFGPARNPWNPRLVTGGSSGGSGLAVATSQCCASLGSDTGGSIRIPSSACGIVGLKPTYSRVSRYGAMPLAWSLDHAGPMTKSVEDAAILLGVLAGEDPKDSTCSSRAVPDYRKDLASGISGLRLGIPKQFFFEHVDREILSAVESAVSKLEELGASRVPVSISGMEMCSAMEAHITLAEAASYYEHLLEKKPEGFSPAVLTDLDAGRFLLATDYVKSQRARTLLQQRFAEAFERADLIVSPTLPAFPPVVGEVYVQSGDLREHIVDAFLRFNIPYDLTGLPAITVPCGFSSSGLPIGLQFAGKPFDEATILRVANAYERATDWHSRHPPEL